MKYVTEVQGKCTHGAIYLTLGNAAKQAVCKKCKRNIKVNGLVLLLPKTVKLIGGRK